jgi:hypothetical protein
MIELIIIFGVVAVIVLFFIFTSKSGAKMLKEREEKMGRASKGKAKILGSVPVGMSGTGHGGRYQAYKFTLEVGDAYMEPYKTKVIWEVYPMGAPKVQDGMEINVKIDADDKNIVYPSADGVSYSWNAMMMNKDEL